MRVLIGAGGGLLALYGVFRLVTGVPLVDLLILAGWLAGALVLHDGILAPLSGAVGLATTRLVPPRLRRYLQGALVAGAAVTVIALPLIARRGSQPPQKALLRQDYAANLGMLLGMIAAGAVALYLLRVVRDRWATQRASAAKVRPSANHTSSSR